MLEWIAFGAFGLLLGWHFKVKAQLQKTSRALTAAHSELIASKERLAASEEKLSLMGRLQETFRSLSLEALAKNNQSFLEIATTTLSKFQEKATSEMEKKELIFLAEIKPIRSSLDQFNHKVSELEKNRTASYSALSEQVRLLLEAQDNLRKETSNLGRALRAPIVRGRWGEIQLKRVVEMAGMLDRCDFFEQESLSLEEGRLRPDLIVRLPAGKQIIVDAKTPLSAYLEAIEAPTEEEKKLKLQLHARQVKTQIMALGRKSYWDQFPSTPEFVILFLPGEIFFSAALEQDPSLIEMGVEQKVILATPTTLIAVLRAVAYGWRQENISQSVQAISLLGKDLYKRLCDMAEHWNKVGRGLSTAVAAFNKATGSLESRVFVTARKFKEMQLSPVDDKLEELAPVEELTRQIQVSKLLEESNPVT